MQEFANCVSFFTSDTNSVYHPVSPSVKGKKRLNEYIQILYSSSIFNLFYCGRAVGLSYLGHKLLAAFNFWFLNAWLNCVILRL